MTMPETTPEMLAMARRIVFETSCSGRPWQRAEIMSGRFDNNDAMKAALAAIKETTERAAVKADQYARANNSTVGTALRNGEHYHD